MQAAGVASFLVVDFPPSPSFVHSFILPRCGVAFSIFFRWRAARRADTRSSRGSWQRTVTSPSSEPLGRRSRRTGIPLQQRGASSSRSTRPCSASTSRRCAQRGCFFVHSFLSRHARAETTRAEATRAGLSRLRTRTQSQLSTNAHENTSACPHTLARGQLRQSPPWLVVPSSSVLLLLLAPPPPPP